jgi:CheY-like chemotaxis protein
VVACSGYTSEKEKEKALKSGMSYYLEKPLKRKEVYSLFESYFD